MQNSITNVRMSAGGARPPRTCGAKRELVSDGPGGPARTTEAFRGHDTLRKDETGRIIGTSSCSEDIPGRTGTQTVERLTRRILEISNQHTRRESMLKEVVREIQDFTGCEAVGIRILDERGNIPYEAYVGFRQEFYEKESPLSIRSDRCMCINVIRGLTDPALPFYTRGGSFYMNATTRFLATVSERDKGQTRNVCHQQGYESVALVPIRTQGDILGILHVADAREHQVPLDLVETLERMALPIGVAVQRILAQEALRRSEERYRGIFENAVLGMYQTTPEGEILAANPVLVGMLGYDTFEELASRNLEEEGFEPEHPRSLFRKRIEAEGQIAGLESAWKRRGGSTLWVRQSARAVRDKAGKILFYEGTVEDITASKRADQLMRTLATTAMELVELPAEADLFQFIGEKVLALIGEGIVSVQSLEGDTLTVRQIAGAATVAIKLAQRLLGRTVMDMPIKGLHKTARTHLPTGKLAKVEGGLHELFFHTVPRPVCRTLEKGAGIEECHSIGIGRPGVLLGSVTILTQKGTELNAEVIETFVNQVSIAAERRKTLEILLKSEELYRSLFENMLNGFAYCRMLFDRGRPVDFIYLDVNQAFETLTGLRNVAGKRVSEVIPGIRESNPELFEIYGRVVRTGRSETCETYVHALQMWLSISVYSPRKECFVTVFDVITARKQAEQQLRDYQNRLRELAARLTLAEEQERRRIAVGVHDQIGQRLALAKLALQSLNASTSDPSTHRLLEDTCKEIDQVIEDAHSLTFELSNPVLYEAGFVDAVASWLAQQIQDRYGLQFTFEADDPIATMEKDTEIALFQITRELLANVVKHAKAKRVDVRIQEADGQIQVTVQDNGVGFDPSKVGMPDSRSGGYGLFSVRERLEYLGGTFRIESVPGQGTCVSVTAPVQSRRRPRGKEASS